MISDVLKEKWKHCRNELRSQWDQLSHDDLDQIDGKRGKLIDFLESRYGYARREVDLFVSDFEEKLRRAS